MRSRTRNKKLLEERDPQVRRRNLDEIRKTAADPERSYQYLLDSGHDFLVAAVGHDPVNLHHRHGGLWHHALQASASRTASEASRLPRRHG